MENEALLKIYLLQELSIEPKNNFTIDELAEKLAAHINDLINNNFQELVALLYRIDVNETKLRNVLKENMNEGAGKIIAHLIIERQLQKIKSRNTFKANNNNESDEERW
jgi:hypothetical protein